MGCGIWGVVVGGIRIIFVIRLSLSLLYALMALTHELGRSWGHGGTKVPIWYVGFGCLVPFGLRSIGLGSPGHHACCQEAGWSLVPCDPGSLGLGGALLLAALTFYSRLCALVRSCSFLSVLFRSCSFVFALASCSASRLSTVACLGLDLSCCGRVGFWFGLLCLFVRSCSRLPPAPPPACPPWPAWVLT